METTQELIDSYPLRVSAPRTPHGDTKQAPEHNRSPFKSHIRRATSVSPLKKTRHDYQDHLFRVRGKERGSVSISGSPVRLQNRPPYADLTVYDAFDDPSPFRASADDVFSHLSRDDSSVDREIDDFVTQEARFLDMETEYAVRDTHKVLNSVPESIVASAEGERYHAMLCESIRKLTREMDNLRHENTLLRDRDRSSEYRIRDLEAKVSQLQVENGRLAARPVDTGASRTNELLRTKLLKYKRLNDECRRWHGDDRMDGLVEQLEAVFRQGRTREQGGEQEKNEAKEDQQKSENTESKQERQPLSQRVLSQNENQSPPRSEHSMYDKFADAARTLHTPKKPEMSLAGSSDILAALNLNSRLYERLLAYLDSQTLNKAGESVEETKNNDSHCHEHESKHSEHQKSSPPVSSCSACTNPMEPSGHDTLQLMGEYKWTIG